jgi:hypothetical protein
MDGGDALSGVALDGGRGVDRIGMVRGGVGPEAKVLSVAQGRAQSTSGRETAVDVSPRNTQQIMENTTPNSLEHMVQQWRAQLAQWPAFKHENIDELEEHLRDSISTLQLKGLSEEEAFLIASRRIGQSEALEKEFGKRNATAAWAKRVLWMLIGIQLWQIVSMVVMATTLNAGYFVLRKIGFEHWGMPAALFCLVYLVGLALTFWACWFVVVKRGEKITGWCGKILRLRRGALLGLSSIVLVTMGIQVGTWLMNALRLQLGDYNSPGRQVVHASYGFSNAVMWWVQMLVFVGLIFVLARRVTGIRPSRVQE